MKRNSRVEKRLWKEHPAGRLRKTNPICQAGRIAAPLPSGGDPRVQNKANWGGRA
jgi:hypothetical protein